ncbi:MAG: hypothetical protein L6R38_006728 [Xanthoria sp. 2 TBL-2021]|nr:MAG: hypothetical protein L6R38_006728 [Xanthoria sp. 2 TBL-2021]
MASKASFWVIFMCKFQTTGIGIQTIIAWQANAAGDGFVPGVAEWSALEANYEDNAKSVRRDQETDDNAGNTDLDDREDAHVKEED